MTNHVNFDLIFEPKVFRIEEFIFESKFFRIEEFFSIQNF